MLKKISALSYMLRYDDRTISKRGRKIKNVDFLRAMRTFKDFENMESTHLSNTIVSGIMTVRKAEKFAKVFKESFSIDCTFLDVIGFREVEVKTKLMEVA